MIIHQSPSTVMKKIEKEYPRIWDILCGFLKDRFSEKQSNTRRDIFLMGCVYDAILERSEDFGFKKTPYKEFHSLQEQGVILAALCPWYYTQTIYEMDTEFFSELAGTITKDVVPFDVFDRFPNYSIYIKQSGPHEFRQLYDDENEAKMMGMWIACVNGEKDSDSCAFSIVTHLVDCNTGQMILHPIALPLFKGLTIEDSIKRACRETGVEWQEDEETDNFMGHIEWASRLVNVLLYLCSNDPDIKDKTPGVTDRRFKLLSGITKNGKFQLFPCIKQKIFSVGQTIVKQIREYESAVNSSNSPIRPHVRRAHWHGYWTGPKKGERTFILKWIPPTLIGTQNGYQEAACGE